jgi:predicted N-acetyltransferase YhbS
MDITIRQETESDQNQVFNIITKAFENEQYSDQKEQFLVERLRKSAAFVPDLSLVAETGGTVVGYILLTKIKLTGDRGKIQSLALAPVAVHPDYQQKGIGTQLITAAHDKARALGFESVIVLGHPGYYPRFGYKKTANFAIKLPLNVPEEYCFALELKENSLKNRGNTTVEFSEEFVK